MFFLMLLRQKLRLKVLKLLVNKSNKSGRSEIWNHIVSLQNPEFYTLCEIGFSLTTFPSRLILVRWNFPLKSKDKVYLDGTSRIPKKIVKHSIVMSLHPSQVHKSCDEGRIFMSKYLRRSKFVMVINFLIYLSEETNVTETIQKVRKSHPPI